jgi:hypothetical protein
MVVEFGTHHLLHHVGQVSIQPLEYKILPEFSMRNIMTMTISLFIAVQISTAQDGFVTAKHFYEEALEEITSMYGNDVQLFLAVAADLPLGPIELEIDVLNGTAQAWIYMFHVPAEQKMVNVLAANHPLFGKMIMTAGEEELSPDDDTSCVLPGWVDSDLASAAMRQFGLQSFFDARPQARGEFMVLGRPRSDMTDPGWVVLAGDDVDQYSCSVDAVTLQELMCSIITNVQRLQEALTFSLQGPWPNPVRHGEAAAINLSLGETTHLRVALYDMSGKRLCVLAEQRFEAGVTTLRIPGHVLPATGVVFVTAESSRGSTTRRLLISP